MRKNDDQVVYQTDTCKCRTFENSTKDKNKYEYGLNESINDRKIKNICIVTMKMSILV